MYGLETEPIYAIPDQIMYYTDYLYIYVVVLIIFYFIEGFINEDKHS